MTGGEIALVAFIFALVYGAIVLPRLAERLGRAVRSERIGHSSEREAGHRLHQRPVRRGRANRAGAPRRRPPRRRCAAVDARRPGGRTTTTRRHHRRRRGWGARRDCADARVAGGGSHRRAVLRASRRRAGERGGRTGARGERLLSASRQRSNAREESRVARAGRSESRRRAEPALRSVVIVASGHPCRDARRRGRHRAHHLPAPGRRRKRGAAEHGQ